MKLKKVKKKSYQYAKYIRYNKKYMGGLKSKVELRKVAIK